MTQSYPPMVSGAAIVAQRLAEGMARRGHRILVLCASDTGPAQWVAQENLGLRRLASVVNPFRVGQRHIPWARGKIVAELRAFQPQIVHTHDVFGMGLTAMTVASALNVPAVATIHQLPWFISAHLPALHGLHPVIESVLWAYARWFTRRCDQLIVPTDAIAVQLQRHAVALPAVISSAVDPRFSPHATSPQEEAAVRRKYGLDPALPIILYVGRIDADKQVDLIVRAALRLVQSNQAQLLIVGDGTRRQAIRQLSDYLGIGHLIRFTGYVSVTEELPAIYRAAFVFVTVSAIETQCLTALEALTSGVPVVTVKTDVMRELVQDGVNGFLISPQDVDALAERLSHLLQDSRRARAMGEAAQEIAACYSVPRMLVMHERLYRSLSISAEHEMVTA